MPQWWTPVQLPDVLPLAEVTLASDPEGFIGVRDPEFEQNWLPLVGPTSFCMLRHFALRLAVDPLPLVELADVGRHLGVTKQYQLAKTVYRLCTFRLAEWTGDVLLVHTKVTTHPGRKPLVLSAKGE